MTDAAQPALFIGHGNPMNALERNGYSDGWRALGAALPRPRAVLCISAHWYVRATMVTAMANPRTIHDFGGFPAELFAVEYPAPGSPEVALEVSNLLRPIPVAMDEAWGLDHGTWSVLVHMFPEADIPVVQVSIDRAKAPAFHYELGRALAPLSDSGVLILGSGNVVHNLETYAWGGHPARPFDWALRFEKTVEHLLDTGDHDPLVNYERLGPDARLSAPTPDHYLPLLYAIGAGRGREVSYPVRGIEGGSISMLSVRLD